MDELIYPRERTLGTITLVLGLLVWVVLVVGTFGGALVMLAVGFLLYLFAQSALIARIKGNSVELSETQFPDLYAHFCACCDRLKMPERPKAYVVAGNGSLNAFATRFLGLQYVVLLSDVIDAMDRHGEGVHFYMGHELGHLRLRHLSGHLLRWPVLWLPLLGAAYSRAKENSCDRHGLACCTSAASAAHALAALSAGAKRWAKLDAGSYLRQSAGTNGFWMSFHELVAGYPDGSHLSLDSRRMVLTVSTARGELIFVPRNAEGQVHWSCTNGERLKPSQLPPSCRTGDGHR
jgi:Zn-dependent protease with chaperone function